MRTLIAATALASLSAATAQAQSTFMWPAPPSTVDGKVFKYFLPIGTPVLLRTRTQVNTRESHLGDRVYLEVAETVAFRGQPVIPVGAPVTAEVVQIQRNGHFGRKGKITVRLIEAQTPSGPVALSGTAYDEGKSGTVASFGTMAFVSVLGFLIHGTSGNIEAATPVQAYLAAPLNFRWQDRANEQAAGLLPAVPDGTAKSMIGLNESDFVSPPMG